MPVLTLPIASKQRLQPLGEMPLKIIGQYADEYMTADSVHPDVVGKAQFQRLESSSFCTSTVNRSKEVRLVRPLGGGGVKVGRRVTDLRHGQLRGGRCLPRSLRRRSGYFHARLPK